MRHHRPGLEAELFTPVQDALVMGQILSGRRLALHALHRAQEVGDMHAEARSLLYLAQADVLDSSFERALDFSTRARSGLEDHGDLEHLAEAVCVASYSAASLGLAEQARDTAQQCVELRQPLHDARIQLRGDNYSGVAAFWRGDFAAAHRQFEAALLAAGESDRPAEAFHPLTNQCFTEMLAVSHAQRVGQDHDMEQLVGLLNACSNLLLAGQGVTFNAWMMRVGEMLVAFLTHRTCMLRGQHAAAEQQLQTCRARASLLPPQSWLHALVWWCEYTQALAAREMRKALFCAGFMEQAARRAQHVPLQRIAVQLMDDLRAESSKSR